MGKVPEGETGEKGGKGKAALFKRKMHQNPPFLRLTKERYSLF